MRQIAGFVAAAVMGWTLFASPIVAAQEGVVPPSAEALRFTFAPIVKTVTPAVVNVYAQRVSRRRSNPVFDDPFFQEFFGTPQRPRDRVQRSLGSGVIVDADGLVITNNHVIEGATEVRVALSDRREFEADIIITDKRADLAVLRLKGVNTKLAALPFAPMDSLQVGDLVLAIGNPFGVGQTVTSGIVSALARSQIGVSDFQSFIQTDAAINPGNSGGALVDMNGRLVGINTAIFSRSGGSIGIGFAIPSEMVRVVVRSAEAGSKQVQRPYVGATFQNLTSEIAETLGLDRPGGALVVSVVEGGPAAEAGLRTSDLVVAIDGTPVVDADDFGYRFATKPIGGTTRVSILRNGKPMDVDVALTIAPETTPRDEITLSGQSPLAGATVANLSPRVAEDVGLPIDATGVVVLRVDDDTPSSTVGFWPRDVILAVNEQRVRSSSDLAELVSQPRRVWRVTIQRDGKTITSVFRG
ncbi:MAG: DegQ family serine endoprotease [Labrys sp. (in: a-proteobacteria)]